MAEDLHSGSLYCARENGSIVGAVSIEWRDEEVERFDCWSKENEPAAYLSRVAMRAYRALAFDFPAKRMLSASTGCATKRDCEQMKEGGGAHELT